MKITLEKLNKIFSEAFGNEVEINFDSNKNNVNEWDSFNHLNLIVELESQLDIKFTAAEIESIKDVKFLLELINLKFQ
jgi:acyl carrier protein